MSFFEDPPPIEVEPEPEPERPEPPWFGPPVGVLPGPVALQVVLARTEGVLITIDRFRAYPTGLSLSFNLFLRRPYTHLHHMPWEPEPGPTGEWDPAALRWGIQPADGSKWTNVPNRFPDFEREPDRPVVMSRGGGGGGREWQGDYWLWPLPAPGDLIFVVAWPGFDVPEQRTIIDTGPLLDAAAAAEIVWPD